MIACRPIAARLGHIVSIGRRPSGGAAHYPRSVPRIQIAPSMLSADFARLGEEAAAIEAAGADRVHWDVMDGQFVPNLTFGPMVVAATRPHTSLPFEAHLMVLDADSLLGEYIAAGCERITVHVEACPHLHRTLGNISERGAKASVSLNPATPLSAIEHVLHMVDMVLVMTVNPGFGGQKYIAEMEPKVRALRDLIDARGLQVDIEVDGGIGPSTVAAITRAGANVMVAGNAVFKAAGGYAAAIAAIRTAGDSA